MNRRRFLTVTAAALATRVDASEVVEWQGTGFGAALSLRLVGADVIRARRTFRRIETEIARIEARFSLFRDSELVRLNRDGRLAWPSEDFHALTALAGRVHDATGGTFDPTVQPLWTAIASGANIAAARALTGWWQVSHTPAEIRLSRGQALTFNGIAQGWAADRIAALLRTDGYSDALIDMGEVQALGQRAGGGGWRATIAGPHGETLAETRLTNRALATSSPRGTLIDGKPHILSPDGRAALWSTVSVSAPRAAVADALSTAFCLMNRTEIATALAVFPGARLEILA